MTVMTVRASSARRSFFALAVLALLIRIVCPPGVMVSDVGRDGPALVICTGHGPMALKTGHDGPTRPSADQTCPFSAAQAAAPPPLMVRVGGAAERFAPQPRLIVAAHVVPGRGLAAPPPPAQAPPLSI